MGKIQGKSTQKKNPTFADHHCKTVRNRLAVYHDQTQPLVNFYRELDGVQYDQLDGVGAVDDIANHITSVLGR